MPFDPNNPNAWIDQITADDPPFARSLCKSLYHEPLLARWPTRSLICKRGMTADGRIGLLEAPAEAAIAMPRPDRMLREGDEEYTLLVQQEDPNALNPGPAVPWPFAMAAFKRCGGNLPAAAPGSCEWRVIHLYDELIHPILGNAAASARAGWHFTQSAALVALHGLACSAKRQYPTIERVLRAKAFTTFNYDPLNQFAPDVDHDDCGFVTEP